MTIAAPSQEQLSHDEADAVASALADLDLPDPEAECDLCAWPVCACVPALPVLRVEPRQPAAWALHLDHPGRGAHLDAARTPAFAVASTPTASRWLTVLLACDHHLALLKHPATRSHLHLRCSWCAPRPVAIARHLGDVERL